MILTSLRSNWIRHDLQYWSNMFFDPTRSSLFDPTWFSIPYGLRSNTILVPKTRWIENEKHVGSKNMLDHVGSKSVDPTWHSSIHHDLQPKMIFDPTWRADHIPKINVQIRTISSKFSKFSLKNHQKESLVAKKDLTDLTVTRSLGPRTPRNPQNQRSSTLAQLSRDARAMKNVFWDIWVSRSQLSFWTHVDLELLCGGG